MNPAVEKTAGGDLVIQPLNHAALRFEYRGKQYYVDPAGRADWANLPKADAIFVTHEHGAHLSLPTIALLKMQSAATCSCEFSAASHVEPPLQKWLELLWVRVYAHRSAGKKACSERAKLRA